MNEVIQTMIDRRSCRAFDPERQISEEQLQDLLTAGLWAASGRGRQNTILIAVQDAEDRAVLSKLNAKYMGKEDFDPYYGARTYILVLAVEDPEYHTGVEDGSLVMGNLMLAAQSMGLASIWIHREKEIFEDEEGKALLKKWGIEGTYRGVGGCAVGYPLKELPTEGPKRKDGRVYIIR